MKEDEAVRIMREMHERLEHAALNASGVDVTVARADLLAILSFVRGYLDGYKRAQEEAKNTPEGDSCSN